MPINLAAAHAAALWAGLLLILLLILSVRVTRLRRRRQVAEGDGGHPDLAGAIRAFGNATEYIPAGIGALAVLAVLALGETSEPYLIHAIGAALFLGRLVHAIGLSWSAGVSRARSIGMLLTWITYVFAAVALLVYAIPS